MTLQEFINACARQINLANERAGAGFPNQAQARLCDLRKLIESEPEYSAEVIAEPIANPEDFKTEVPS